jgi:UDP-glucose 4-epimerase
MCDTLSLHDALPIFVIVAAALKQVDTCETFTGESIATNLLGTQNVVAACNEVGTKLETVLFVSTDKACAPVNVYGMCKSLSERVIVSQASLNGGRGIRYMCVRYGNVLESRGSIIPLFRYQAENAPELTVTDPDMTRYVMTLDDSVSLIDHAIHNGNSGETWIPKLKAMKIGDLAQIFADRHGKKVHVTGIRPGEKKHEDLINESESVRSVDVGTHYVIKSALSSMALSHNQKLKQMFTYSSNQTVMSREELEAHLTELGILDCPLDKFQQGASIEEIKK